MKYILLTMAFWVPVLMADNNTDIIKLAAEVKPAERQLIWQQTEFNAFVHFGMNTFTDREWGTGKEDPKLFNPSSLDTRQWARVFKEAGIKIIIITAKHHDGFCLWPSKYTEHSVKNSLWKDGKGDVVGELSSACREYGLKLGIYLSPWDRHEPTYGTGEPYNKYYMNQLSELLTEYGSVAEVWFDGACGEGPNGQQQVYDWEGFYQVVRKLQPNAVISVAGPDVRWVGNEEGYARETEWSVVPANTRDQKKIAENFANLNWMDLDIGSREKILKSERLIWYPAECDTGIRPGWFFNPNYKTKSLQSLLSTYLNSVGRNAVLLLNVPPDKRGLIHEEDVQRLGELRQSLDSIFKTNLALNAGIQTCSVRDHNDRFSADKALDGKDDTFWSPNEIDGGCFEFDLGKIQKINCLLIQENIRNGQRVESFIVEAKEGDGWRKIAEGTTIGYKRILCFDELDVQKIRVRINQSRSYPEISNFAVYYASQSVINPM